MLDRIKRLLPARHGADRLLLVTANFGGIDEVRPLPDGRRFDACYYTDEATASAADPAVAATWSRMIVPNYPRHDFSPRLRGRYFKHQIHRLPEAEGCRWLAWADANVRWHDPEFLMRAVERLRASRPHRRVMLIAHPFRRTIREEYEYIQAEIDGGSEYCRIRYGAEKMPEQMAFFAERGWNLEAPLWCGTVWVVENSPVINRCWDAWWDQNLRFGLMDQLSLPVIMDQFGIEPQDAGISLVDNPHFTWEVHAKLA